MSKETKETKTVTHIAIINQAQRKEIIGLALKTSQSGKTLESSLAGLVKGFKAQKRFTKSKDYLQYVFDADDLTKRQFELVLGFIWRMNSYYGLSFKKKAAGKKADSKLKTNMIKVMLAYLRLTAEECIKFQEFLSVADRKGYLADYRKGVIKTATKENAVKDKSKA